MPYIKGKDIDQITFLPNTVDDYVDEDNPVRVINEFVEILDMKASGFQTKPAEEGRPGYDPKDMIKLYIYGYMFKIRSSRKLQIECRRNLELIWLLKEITPDFRCIADFRKNNYEALKNVNKEFVIICEKLKLLSKELVAKDGSKFRAANAKEHVHTKNSLTTNIKNIDKKIDKYLKEVEQNDKLEESEFQRSVDELKIYIEKLKEKKFKWQELLKQLNESGERQVALTDPDCKLMKTRNGFDPCYNIQTIVEAQSHMIIDCEATNEVNDINLLTNDMKEIKEILNVDKITIVADKGYRDNEEILKCLLNGDTPDVYTNDEQDCHIFEFEKTEDEITEEIIASKETDIIKRCISAGVLPEILRDKKVIIENKESKLQEMYLDEETGKIISKKEAQEQVVLKAETPLSEYFIRDLETDTIICPMGQRLYRSGKTNTNKPDKQQNPRYSNRKACENCKNKCTAGKYCNVTFKDKQIKKRAVFYDKCFSGKPVWRTRGKLKKIMAYSTPKIILKFYPDYKKIKLRGRIVEHPFGTIKRWCDCSYFLLKGKKKVEAEVALMCLGYNIKRAIKILGTRKLIEMMKAA